MPDFLEQIGGLYFQTLFLKWLEVYVSWKYKIIFKVVRSLHVMKV
jgi:hypothetical protein